jgi:hypothetical protein
LRPGPKSDTARSDVPRNQNLPVPRVAKEALKNRLNSQLMRSTRYGTLQNVLHVPYYSRMNNEPCGR